MATILPDSPATVQEIPSDFLGESPALISMLERARRAADSNAAILILGESGTGKASLARAIHRWSRRAEEPFIRVDCGALAPEALERELFGRVRGEFEDGPASAGRLEAAHTGTLFLDDVDAASSIVQVKLVRVLQEQQYELLGDPRPLDVDVRIIAASRRDLAADVTEGRFREDLYWRLNVVPIFTPPLRRRREDIPQLAGHYLRRFARRSDRSCERIQPAAMTALQQYGWPGNLKELQNYIERAVVLADGPELTVDLLPGAVTGDRASDPTAFRGADSQSLIEEFVHNGIAADRDAKDLHARMVTPVERELIIQVLAECDGVQKKAADRLGMNRNTLRKKIAEHGIE